MGSIKISNLPLVDELTSRDYFIIDGDTGSKKISTSNLLSSVQRYGLKQSIFRGKYLGTHMTKKQAETIENGIFEDIFVGDYWSNSRGTWRVADIDTFYTESSYHHIVVVPDNVTETSRFYNDVALMSYTESDVNKSGMSAAKYNAAKTFGDRVYAPENGELNIIFENGSESIKITDSSFTPILMSETEVFGNIQNGEWNYSNSTHQFSLFRLNPNYILSNTHYWLRDGFNRNQYGSVASQYGYSEAKKMVGELSGVRPYVIVR